MVQPLDPAKQQEIVRLAESGMPRNEIARKVGCSYSTVTKWATRAGVEFDRSITQAAVEARQMDLKALRKELAVRTARRAIQIDDMFQGVTDTKKIKDLTASMRDETQSHFNISRLDMGNEESTESAKEALREFIIGAKERVKEIEAEQHRRDILEQPEQPAIEHGNEKEQP